MAAKYVRWAPTLALVMALPLLAQPAGANDAVSKQVGTASAHAGMALGAADLATAQAHLHHVVNCLVGPSGEGYDANEADPCKGMGQGALVDARDDAALEARLQAAVTEAVRGAKASTVAQAHAQAQKVVSSLQSH